MNKRYLITGIILTAVLAGGIFFLRKKQQPLPAITHLLTESQTRTKGPADAPIQLIVFSDFQCPACRKAVPDVENLLAAYPGKIHFVFYHYPLPAHPFSPLAHQAAECAAQANQFWKYHDLLYQEQEHWSLLLDPTETFMQFARDIGLNLDAFAQCLTDEQVRRRIYEDKAKGERLKINSTPTFFLNGDRLLGGIELRLKGEAKIREILGLPPQAGKLQLSDYSLLRGTVPLRRQTNDSSK